MSKVKPSPYSSTTEPAVSARAVTPNDSEDLPSGTCRALYIGVGGDVEVVLFNDAAAVTLVGVPAGAILPVKAKRVRAENTDATDIIALY